MSKSIQFLIFIILTNVILIGTVSFLVYYIKTTSEDASALSFDLDDLRKNKGENSQLQKSLNETKKEREKLDSLFVHSSGIDNFIESIIKLGENSGIKITLSGLTETKNDTLSIELRGSGRFEDLYYFIKLLEHIPYKIELIKVYLNSAGALGGDGTTASQAGNEWDGSFTIVVHGFIKD